MKRLKIVPVLLVAALLLGCASEAPPPDEGTASGAGYEIDESQLDSFALINLAMSSGDLDYSTGTLYKVYAVFDPLSLPPEYESDVPGKSGTPLIMEVQRNWNRLTPEHREEISQYIEPIGEGDTSDTQLDDVTPDRLEDARDSLE
jgi:hypothetical protein